MPRRAAGSGRRHAGLCYWRDRVDDPLGLSKVQAGDEHPRVRLEAVRAASFFRGADIPKAQEVVNESLLLPERRLSEIHLRRNHANARPASRRHGQIAGQAAANPTLGQARFARHFAGRRGLAGRLFEAGRWIKIELARLAFIGRPSRMAG